MLLLGKQCFAFQSCQLSVLVGSSRMVRPECHCLKILPAWCLVKWQLPQQSNPFDLAKSVFDLHFFWNIRGDALAKYNSLIQSEPLCINLSELLALIFFASPLLSIELFGTALHLPQTTGVILGAVAFSTLLFMNVKDDHAN